MNRIETLIKGSEELELNLTEDQKKKFLRFKDLLQEWNQKIDITTIIEDEEVDIKHFLDSLTPIKTGLFEGPIKLIDIGTGGGFPGIPLKIYNEEIDMTLMDSLRKRINFLDVVISDLGLENMETTHGRAEELSRTKEYREIYDICISRAVAQLDTLVEYCIPFVKVGGHFISMKGPDPKDEINQAKNAINTLGGKVVDYFNIQIPGSDIEHSLIIIEKTRATPKKYPRGGGKPRSKPL